MKFKKTRPDFPKRAVITAGMPYGNKSLHFGHIGGVFVPADMYFRFLKDRIGAENVIFVSGTDCYGSPIVASHKKHVDETGDAIELMDYVTRYHLLQKEALNMYEVAPSLYAASAFGEGGTAHEKVSEELFYALYNRGVLKKMSAPQFYDPIEEVFLNGRQVVGKCPFEGCQSTKGYADECDLGHQYMPEELVEPISILSGETPVLKDTLNWYFDLEAYGKALQEMVNHLSRNRAIRSNVKKITEEFIKPPAIHITRKELEKAEIAFDEAELIDDPKKKSITYVFKNLEQREKAQDQLVALGIRFRTAKALVPFRLSGNIDWGVPVPNCEGVEGLTYWVWPESLWAPISFTIAYLKSKNMPCEDWKKWWLSEESKVYQFIGEDNIYFYGIAEMAMLMAYSDILPDDLDQVSKVNFPTLVANCHLLFFNSKASSSGNIKPPMADELLEHYTSDQLRMHFLSLGLSKKSVPFSPKAFNPEAAEDEADHVLKDGNLLTGVLNRLLRSCFYTTQTYCADKVPRHKVSGDVKEWIENTVIEYENCMAEQAFHKVIYTVDDIIRKMSKYWSAEMKKADQADDQLLREQVLADVFYASKCILTLLHPIVPTSAENVQKQLRLNDSLWNWDMIFDDITVHMDDSETHVIEAIPPKYDFFKKHASQL